MLIDAPSPVYVPGTLKKSISSPNGIDLLEKLRASNPDISKIIASVSKHTTPSSSILDVADPLNAALVAQYPKAHYVTSKYSPNIKSGVNVKGLSKAYFLLRTVIDDARHKNAEEGTRPSTNYFLITTWHRTISKNSVERIITITIKTSEHLTPSICDLRTKIIQSRDDSNLGQIHPTLAIHQKVAERTVPFLEEEEETAPLRLARLVFDLADEQSPCKRMDTVIMKMKISAKKTENPSGDNVHIFSYESIDRDRYEQSQNSKLADMLPNGSHRVYIALGSNVGDRIANIESACQRMHDRGIKVTRTSALYETKAMYLEDQQSFINGACEVSGAQAGRYSFQTKSMIYRLTRFLVQTSYSISSKQLRKIWEERRPLRMVLAPSTWTYSCMRTRFWTVKGSRYPTSEC